MYLTCVTIKLSLSISLHSILHSDHWVAAINNFHCSKIKSKIVKCVVFYVHVHVSEICSKKFPKNIDFSRKPVRFQPNIAGRRRLLSAPSPSLKKFRKDMVHFSHILCKFSINGNFEMRKFFRKHSN